jgi:hypothetical protein
MCHLCANCSRLHPAREKKPASAIRILTDAVHLLVHLGTVEVTLLTSTGNGPGDTGRVPGTDTSDLAETLVRLAGQLGNMPPGDDTLWHGGGCEIAWRHERTCHTTLCGGDRHVYVCHHITERK